MSVRIRIELDTRGLIQTVNAANEKICIPAAERVADRVDGAWVESKSRTNVSDWARARVKAQPEGARRFDHVAAELMQALDAEVGK